MTQHVSVSPRSDDEVCLRERYAEDRATCGCAKCLKSLGRSDGREVEAVARGIHVAWAGRDVDFEQDTTADEREAYFSMARAAIEAMRAQPNPEIAAGNAHSAAQTGEAVAANLPTPASGAETRGLLERRIANAKEHGLAGLEFSIPELEAIYLAMRAHAITQEALHIVLDGPPGPEAGRFVECETPDGRSVNAGEWHKRGDGYWELRISHAITQEEVDDGRI